MKFSIAVFLLLFLSGCASSTGIVPTGNDEYMVSQTDMGDVWRPGESVLAQLYIKANDFSGEDKEIETIEEKSADGRVFVRNVNATLRFRCVEKR